MKYNDSVRSLQGFLDGSDVRFICFQWDPLFLVRIIIACTTVVNIMNAKIEADKVVLGRLLGGRLEERAVEASIAVSRRDVGSR